jgi:TolB-like protein/DNA-binding winged helix-turn-helix (wHTH) protein/Tfp pilus assembly protein PilF
LTLSIDSISVAANRLMAFSAIRFGSFEVIPAAGEVRKGGVKIKLQEKPYQLLLLLLERPGEIVTREEVRRALWPADTFVDFDHSLGTAIAKLRTALGDSARSPRFVETVAGRGYKFIAPVTRTLPDQQVDEAAAHGPEEPAPAQPARSTHQFRRAIAGIPVGLLAGAAVLTLVLGFDISGIGSWLRRHTNGPVGALAVLPLQNLSNDSTQEYFVDGMTEQLITSLAQLRGVQVISRTSVMQYKGAKKPLPEIGRDLKVDALIEGSVMRSDNRVRISAQLVDARTDAHLWAGTYERDIGDTLALQDEIARAIADEIRATLAGRPGDPARTRRVIPAAEEAYLRGRYHLNQGSEAEILKSVDEFNAAIAVDAGHARSYAGLASAYIALTDFYERPSLMMPRGRAAAEQAVRLDDGLSEAHATLGAIRFLYDWDWTGAEVELKRAVDLSEASADAHLWYGVFLAQMGRFEKGIAEVRRAETLDPLSVMARVNAGWVYFLARRTTDARAEWQKALEIEPHLGSVHTAIWMAYAQQGNPGTSSPAAEGSDSTNPVDLATLAGAYAMSGRREDAERVLARLQDLSATRYVCPYEIATARAALGQHEEALSWLRKAVNEHSVCIPDIKTDPRLDVLRDNPVFKSLLREVGF